MARITRINTNVARQVLHSIVAKADDKYHNKGVSKTAFKKDILGKVQGQYLGVLRGGQKSITRNELKHSVKELTEFLKAHPKFTVNRRGLEKMGVRAYEGSALREDFDNEEFLKRADRYAVGQQVEQEKDKDTGPTPEEKLKTERRQRAMRGLNLYRSKQERDDLASGKKSITPTSVTSDQAQKSGVSATSHEGAGTIAGASKVAGSPSPSTPIPGQHASAPTPQQQSRGAVPLVSLGLHGVDGRPADRADDIAIPRIGSAKEDVGTDKNIPNPGLKTEDADVHPDKDDGDELPSTKDIDKGLPFLGE